MEDEQGYRARFRFRVRMPLNIQEKKHRINVMGCNIDISPRQPETPICDSQWLVANCSGFKSEEEARSFADKLKAAVDISSIATRLGVDTGTDLATSQFAQSIKDNIREEHGIIFRDDIHGIDVFSDDPNMRFPFVSGNATAMMSPDPFLNDLNDFLGATENSSQPTKDVVLLLNYALMRPDPTAQIVFAFSAVEMLGQREKWSASQKELLGWLANEAQKSDIGTDKERLEVADAIQRGTNRLSLRQGVMLLLSSLKLDHLGKKWDELYKERSKLIHGLAPSPGARYDELANRVVSLCGHILLKEIAKDVPMADRYVDCCYEL